jgi:DNA-binding transcriptional LysR family regulator
VQLTFHALNMPQQLEGLERGELDLGVIWLPSRAEGFDVQEVVREPLIAVLPATHRLAKSKEVSIRQLSGEPMILPSRTLHAEVYDEIARAFERARAVLNSAYELESSLSMINFVAMGVGCSLLPGYVRSIRQQGVVFRPLRSPQIVKTLALIKKKGRKGLAEAFFQFARQTLA